jgi:hypothetical protein
MSIRVRFTILGVTAIADIIVNEICCHAQGSVLIAWQSTVALMLGSNMRADVLHVQLLHCKCYCKHLLEHLLVLSHLITPKPFFITPNLLVLTTPRIFMLTPDVLIPAPFLRI